MKNILLKKNEIPEIENKTVVAIGKFDGVHRGHEKLLKKLMEYKDKGYTTVVFTFERSLAQFFSGEKQQLLTTDIEKQEIMKELGVDVLAQYPVNAESVAISPEDFVRIVLVDWLHAKAIIAGPDCSFGARGAGNIQLLKEMGEELDFETVCIQKELEEDTGLEISSTYVRQEVTLGHMEHAASLLGYPYSLIGKVMHGRKLGRQLSMPTVNLIPDGEKLLPPFGVYYSRVYVGTQCYAGITNVGRKPTVNDTTAITVETYLYDFDDDLYGENIKVELLAFKRPEMKFSGVEELMKQMNQDMLDGDVYRRNFK